MPNRVIREGFLDSARIDALSADADRFYFRLLLVVDDAGRYDARATFLAASCWPLRRDKRASDVSEWLQECAANELLILYEYQSRPYLQIARWKRCGNSERSKFPWSDGSYDISYVTLPQKHGDVKPPQFVATSMLVGPHAHPMPTPQAGEPTSSPVPSSSTSSSTSEGGPGETYNLPPTLDTPSFRETWAKWVQHRREIRKKLTPTAVEQQWKHLAELGVDRAVAAILHSIAQGWTGIYEPGDSKSPKKPAPTVEQAASAMHKSREHQERLNGIAADVIARDRELVLNKKGANP